MSNFYRSTMNPAGYHGQGKKAPYFEGWYLKLVNADQTETWAVIPGIFIGSSATESQAFIQVLRAGENEVHFHPFPAGAFHAAAAQFDVRLGGNHFSQHSLTLDLPDLQGRLSFHNTTPWPVTLRSPGIMGWYAWVPFMECYHGVVSLDHTIEGALRYRGETLDFSGGRGYIEKDWGRNFPSTWIWMQSNHFSHNGQPSPGTSLTASIARIPWIGHAFPGFIIGLWHEQVLHRFTTYVGATMETVSVTGETVHCVVRNRTHRLELLTERAPGGLLYAPTPAGMAPKVRESVSAAVTARLTTLDGRLLFEGRGSSAGLEVEGDTSILAP